MSLSKAILFCIKSLHTKFNYSRRVSVLASQISPLIPKNAKVLDIGCGDGDIDYSLLQIRSDISITGIDIYKRNITKIAVIKFDGKKIPFKENSFDCVLLIDVLHHTKFPDILIGEANRVAKKCIVIKDHYANSKKDHLILRFLDWVGNKPHGVVLVYNYLSSVQWRKIFQVQFLIITKEIHKLDLYPFPFSYVFEKSIQFIIKLEKSHEKN